MGHVISENTVMNIYFFSLGMTLSPYSHAVYLRDPRQSFKTVESQIVEIKKSSKNFLCELNILAK